MAHELRCVRNVIAKRTLLAATVSSLTWLASPALAGFQPGSGRVELEGALVSGLDDADALDALPDFKLLGHDLNEAFGRAPTFVGSADDSIEGDAALLLDDDVGGIDILLDGLAPTLGDRRIEARFWYLPEGTVPVAEIYFIEVGGRAVLDNPQAPFAAVGSVRFWPTGRATDDGWVEMSTGPFDFSAHGAVRARMLRIVDDRTFGNAFFGIPPTPGASVRIDALEIVDVGARTAPDVACNLAGEAATCGAEGVCLFGFCADAAIAEGTLPSDARIRTEYLDYQVQRLRRFAGSRYIGAQIDTFEARMNAAKDRPLPELWATFRRAHDELADGHLSTPFLSFLQGLGASACLYESDADLLPDAPVAPMVSRLLPGHPVSEMLAVGDVLVAIDGIAVDEWAERAERLLRYGGDQRGRSFIIAPDLLPAAIRGGSTLSFARCAQPTPCTTEELQTIEVDGAALVADLFTGARPAWWFQQMNCDYRFTEAVPRPPRDDDFVGHVDDPEEAIRTIVINGVSGDNRWMNRVRDALTGVPDGVILDERFGGGGTFEGVAALLAPFLRANEDPIAMVLPRLAPELDDATRQQIMNCQNLGGQSCGNAFVLPMTLGGVAPTPRPEARVAIVNGLDVSGNDFLPYALRRRAGGQTRIFGAVPTYGAFGPLSRMPRVAGELFGGSFQVHDTVFLADLTETSTTFETGFGVEPDEVVRQKQSDALAGVDTLLARARAWILEGAD